MIRPAFSPRVRLGLFAVSALGAVAAGFVLVTPARAADLIQAGGYYYIAALFAIAVHYALRVVRRREAVWRGWLRAPGWAGAAILAGSLVLVWMDPYRHKVLFDEYVLQGTAFHLHATKEVGTVVRAYDVQGTWLPIDTFLDKRPYFFAFLLSLLHDLTGFRVENVHVLNTLLAPVALGLFYRVARMLMPRAPALLALGLVATLPLTAQQVTGAGMELHNLVMLLGVTAAAALYLRAPDDDRLSLLVAATVLLAQSRYEAVLFVFPVAAAIAFGWWRAGRVILPWPAVVAPLLLVPYAWHNRIVAETPLLWQLGDGQSSRFSVGYLAGNLEGAWRFLSDRSGTLPNSWYLSALGIAGAAFTVFQVVRAGRLRPRGWTPAAVALGVLAAGVFGNVAILMFYYWARFDDVMASRFALPLCVLLALLAGRAVAAAEIRWRPATVWAGAGLAVWFAGWGVPATARRLYTEQNLVMQEVAWEYAELRKRDPSLLFVTNKSTIPFVLWRIPTVINRHALLRGPQIAYHLGEGTFREVVVAQALRPTSADGNFGVAPEDRLPPGFVLETIAERRFGARMSRLSRLVEIRPAAPAPNPGDE